MAKSNMLGASNQAAGPGEVGYMPPEAPEAVPGEAAAGEVTPPPPAPAEALSPPRGPSLLAHPAGTLAAATGVDGER